MSDSDEHNERLGVLDQLIGQKLKTAEGRRKVASFASQYCRDVATHGTKLDTSSHRMMLQRISEILRAYGDELDALKEWEGRVVVHKGAMMSESVGLESSTKPGCSTVNYEPLDHALLPFDGKKVRALVLVEEVP